MAMPDACWRRLGKLACDFIGLQETRRSDRGKPAFLLQGIGSSALGKMKRKAGKYCSELGWQSTNRYAANMCVPHQLVDERLMSMRFELAGECAAVNLVAVYVPTETNLNTELKKR